MPVPGGEPASPASRPAIPAPSGPRPAPPAPHGTHGHSRRAAASPARTEGPGRRRSGDITQGSSAPAALPLPFPSRAGPGARSDALPAPGPRVAAAAAPSLFPPAAAMGLTRQYLRYEPAALFGLVASARAGLAFVALRGERGRYVAVPACEHVFVWDTRKGEKVGAGSGAGAGPGCSVRGSWAAWSEGICAAERRLGGSDTSRASPPLGKGEHSPRLCYKVSLQLAHCPAVFQFSKLVY